MSRSYKKLQTIIESTKSILLTLFAGNTGSQERDEMGYSKLGWLVLGLGFGGFILWATFAPLDKGVSAQGTVISDGQRKVVQPAVTGIIDQILVKDGDIVQEGQLLVKMNSIQAEAQTDSAKEAMAGLDAQIAGLENSTNSQATQLMLINQQLAGMRDLAKEGYVAKNRVLELEREKARLEAGLAENRGALERSRRQLGELQKKMPAYQFDLENTTIEAPVNGSVINLAVFTKGQVVQAGTKLMEISPMSHGLVVEAKVPVNLIDKVHVGLPVEMIFSALNQRTTPRIPGEVSVVSADRTTDERTGEAFYKIQVVMTAWHAS
jgi:membrane fusion protein, protease secretion system